jgi:sigma-B regulation protein RsbU (phosphoserine phosphatase)
MLGSRRGDAVLLAARERGLARGAGLLDALRAADRGIARQVVAGPRLWLGLALGAGYLSIAVALSSSRLALFHLVVGFGILMLFLDAWAYLLLVIGWLLTPHAWGPSIDVALLTAPMLGFMLEVAIHKLRAVTALERQVQSQNEELQQLMLEKLENERAREEYVGDVRAQLALARRVQDRLMHRHASEFVLDGMRASVSAVSRACKEVGGDFFRVLRLSPSSMAVVVGDVMGKGVAAALVMTMMLALFDEAGRETSDPGAILSRVNVRLHDDLGEEAAVFVTAAVVVLDGERRRCRVANAGHETPLLCQRRHVAALGGPPGLPLGIERNESYAVEEMRIHEGDRLLLYTDGLVQAEDEQKPGVGRRDLRHCLRDLDANDAERVLERLGVERAADDVTVLTVEVEAIELESGHA